MVVEQVFLQAWRGLCRGVFHISVYLLSYGAFRGLPGSAGAAMQRQHGTERSRYEHRLACVLSVALALPGHWHWH